MNTEQTILETLRVLSPDQQQEVLDFVEFLSQKAKAKQSLALAQGDSQNLLKFKQLVAAWRTEQDPFSSILNFEHPAYQAIINMGMEAIPLILRELQEEPDYWFWALQEITKENPVLPADEGNLNSMTAAWLNWGTIKGYIK